MKWSTILPFIALVTALSPPLLSPPSGTYFNETLSVNISCLDQGATAVVFIQNPVINQTNATIPTQALTASTWSIQINSSTSIGAYCSLTGNNSQISTADYLYSIPIPKPPVISPSGGKHLLPLNSDFYVYMELNSNDTNLYGTDLVLWNFDSTKDVTAFSIAYDSKIALGKGTYTLQARTYRWRGQEYTNSSLVAQTYKIVDRCSIPVISPTPGHYRDAVNVTVTRAANCTAPLFISVNNGSYVQYITDSVVIPIIPSLYGSAVVSVTAYAEDDTCFKSNSVTSQYMLLLKTSNPLIQLPDNTTLSTVHSYNVTLNISCPDTYASLSYNTSVAVDAKSFSNYVLLLLNDTTTVNVRCVVAGQLDSDIVIQTIQIDSHTRAPVPALSTYWSNAVGMITVVISSPPSCQVWWTLENTFNDTNVVPNGIGMVESNVAIINTPGPNILRAICYDATYQIPISMVVAGSYFVLGELDAPVLVIPSLPSGYTLFNYTFPYGSPVQITITSEQDAYVRYLTTDDANSSNLITQQSILSSPTVTIYVTSNLMIKLSKPLYRDYDAVYLVTVASPVVNQTNNPINTVEIVVGISTAFTPPVILAIGSVLVTSLIVFVVVYRKVKRRLRKRQVAEVKARFADIGFM